MTEVIIYTKAECSFCEKAKKLLDKNSYSYREIKYPDEASKDDIYAVMPIDARADRLLFPQIIVNGHYVGGYDDLEDYFWDLYDNRSDDYLYGETAND